jgi:hypothetical protein
LQTRAKKILFGCLGGCGFLLLMTIGSCIGVTVWFNSPGEVLDPQILLGPENTAYVEWTLRLEDSGTAEFVEGMLTSFSDLNARSDSPLPDGLEHLINTRQIAKTRKNLRKLFPLVVAWTARPGDTLDEDEHLFTLSARGLGHRMVMADWMLGLFLRWNDDIETVRHRGEKIFVLNDLEGTRPAGFINKGVTFFATDLDSARAARDRLDLVGDESLVQTELSSLFGNLVQTHALKGGLTNHRGELRRLLDVLESPDEVVSAAIWDDVQAATIVANFSDDVFAGTLALQGPDEDWARTHVEAIGVALGDLFEHSRIEFATEVNQVGSDVHIAFNTTNLFEQIEAINQ